MASSSISKIYTFINPRKPDDLGTISFFVICSNFNRTASRLFDAQKPNAMAHPCNIDYVNLMHSPDTLKFNPPTGTIQYTTILLLKIYLTLMTPISMLTKYLENR